MVKFGSRVVGGGEPCFVTFEAGPTHSGLASALRLVDHAADAGADAVKFQIADPDRLVADRKQLFSYSVLADRATGRTEPVSEPLYDILARRALSFDAWRKVKAQCDARGLAFFATVTFDDEVALVEELGCHSIKIASADVNHLPFIRRCARTGMCIQLDTGNATIGEIEAAVDIIRSEGNENIIIHHCPSGYPARLDGINLRVITTLKQFFPYPVAYSDHSPGWEMDVAAIALGADLVEKTITEDRMTRSVEHVMSLEPADMARFVTLVKELHQAFGTPRRLLTGEEREKRKAVRRSAFLKENAKAGTALRDLPIEYRRPGFGIGPDQIEMLGDSRLAADRPAGHRLSVGDLTG